MQHPSRARTLSPLLLMLVCAGCASSYVSAIHDEAVRSTVYDEIPCSTLKSRRAALIAQHGDPVAHPDERQPGEVPAYLPTGAGVLFPDWRSEAAKEQGKARGQIKAMTNSLQRRECEAEPPVPD